MVVFVFEVMRCILLTCPLIILSVPSIVVLMTTVALRRLLRKIGTPICLCSPCLILKYLGVPTLLRPTLLKAGLRSVTTLISPLGLCLLILTLKMLTLVNPRNRMFPFLTIGPVVSGLTVLSFSIVALPATIVIRPVCVAMAEVLVGLVMTVL